MLENGRMGNQMVKEHSLSRMERSMLGNGRMGKNGQGMSTSLYGEKYVGEWKNGKPNGQGTFTFSDGEKYVGEWKKNELWNGTQYDKNGNIDYKYVIGNKIKQ
jgi:hypothetical protein